jgi:drug/metabolite transporter (DMT)-like permease
VHRTTGRWQLGLALALTTAVFWGVLPIALKVALEGLDPFTITWYRFAVAVVVLGAILTSSRRLPAFGAFGRRGWTLVGIAVVGLTGNYVLYLVALAHASPTINQTVGQLSPMLFLVGGVLLFKERFSVWQWAGFGTLLLGLLLFFNRRLPELADLSGGLGLGVTLLVLAAILWAMYGLAQKLLLRRLSSPQVLWTLYLGAIVVLLPATHPGDILRLNGLQLGMLAFCCANTLIGYGAFAEALQHWEVSRVGAVLATAPLFTLAGVWLVNVLVPSLIAPEGLNALSVLGALLVVGGSAACALASPGS